MLKKKILFGAGRYGHLALKKYGNENVAFFVDNNLDLLGNKIDGIPVISAKQLGKIYEDYEIVVTTKYTKKITEQLLAMNITEFTYYKDGRYYPVDDLIVNLYKGKDAKYLDTSQNGNKQKIEDIDLEVERLHQSQGLFDHVEIETINRCNGNCSFCPVSRKSDTRKMAKMSRNLFVNIIDQLGDIDYKGKLALFSNNEPF